MCTVDRVRGQFIPPEVLPAWVWVGDYLTGACLDCKIFRFLFVTSNLGYMYRVLNVDKKITNYTV